MQKIQNPELCQKGIVIADGDYTLASQLRSWIPESLLLQERNRMIASQNPLDYVVDLAPKLPRDVKISLLKWALESQHVNQAASYLGFMPRLATIYVLYHIPKADFSYGAMNWHRDTMVHKGLNMFMAISDVTDFSGVYSAVPLDVIPKSCVIEKKARNIDLSSPMWNRYRLTDLELSDYVHNSKVITLKGPPGTTAWVASGDVYHKGGHCLKNERIMLEISYQSDCFQGGCSDNIISNWGLDDDPDVLSVLNDPLNKYLLEKPSLLRRGPLSKIFWAFSRYGRTPLKQV